MKTFARLAAALALLAVAPQAARAASPARATGGDARARLNRAALELGLPLHWRADANANGAIDPPELALVFGLDERPRDHWIRHGRFTPAFRAAWASVESRASAPQPAPAGADAARRAALARELSQRLFAVVEMDRSGLRPPEREMLRHLVDAARIIERLNARQLGILGMAERIPPGDGASRLAFLVNKGPWCTAPATEGDPSCGALSPVPPRRSGLYPADLQADPGFCAGLARGPDADALTSPFTAVARDARGGLAAVPYPKAWPEDMEAVARALERAASAIRATDERALHAYLLAAARAFRDGGWERADEAWASMNAENSRWFLRVAPDETYSDPCALKAGFELALARIDPGSLAWQRRLEPVKQDMEATLARLAGPPYAARPVAFHLPDFIAIALNAGDARAPRGATVGQSLPNWGKVANEGRGRTVAMTNFYTDPESLEIRRRRAASVLCADTMARRTPDPDAERMGFVLHEAAHNLGPSHEYAVKGRTAPQIFGGNLAAMLEELKAQQSALYLAGWLAERGVISPAQADRALLENVVWAFGQVSVGVRTSDGRLRPYSALAAIQLAALADDGALVWRPEAKAANGEDEGCLELDRSRLGASVERLEALALGIKARGDRRAAEALVQAHVDAASGKNAELRRVITERWRRFPDTTFLYATP
ncbi:conserved hypothetical protein [Anaeromyxobacter dehalogenans 2CP-1]|uniref:EF-hand domain-containing protein n=1 Tax=Anaeromyxobacter dehalogenans (strain ATCC BAA-258 / DSM 21875 / 2CP-1) TaxID=455488 RepID=B8JG93_ANAD2|nr:hypothetical protein [Anaeromyxobacter dehalogenans]ACL66496.1 conserved hypothetical protein [Anaeromyxobacter dehalogenans 2CP-1]